MPKRWTGMAGPIHIFVARLVYRFGKGEGERHRLERWEAQHSKLIGYVIRLLWHRRATAASELD